MILKDVMVADPHRKRRKVVGRGIGSGRGKTSTRGYKGQSARTGYGGKIGLMEGGQMPLYRRLPRRGFSNARFAEAPYSTVNLGLVEARFQSGETVSLGALIERGLVPKAATRVKILGTGELQKKLTFQVEALSSAARKKIEAASGTILEAK